TLPEGQPEGDRHSPGGGDLLSDEFSAAGIPRGLLHLFQYPPRAAWLRQAVYRPAVVTGRDCRDCCVSGYASAVPSADGAPDCARRTVADHDSLGPDCGADLGGAGTDLRPAPARGVIRRFTRGVCAVHSGILWQAPPRS